MRFEVPTTILLTTYFTACGFAYIWGFWYRAEIDISIILQLLTVTEIVKAAALSFIIFLGAGVSTFFSTVMTFFDYKKNLFKDALDSPRRKTYMLFMMISNTMIFMCGTSYFKWAFASRDQFYIYSSMSFTGAALLMIPFFYNTYIFPNLNIFIRAFVLISLFFTPPTFFLLGGISYQEKLNEPKGLYIFKNEACPSNEKEKFKLLAVYGSKGVAISDSNQTICVFSDNEQSYYQQKTEKRT
ncbi:hypothetical protein [Aeromonas hydrophila]|uniref:hypothetical protein n=1 Tax=Aeromonas hydrophila TaxID=644 RepID=UPI001890A6A9|nr:hypothetical protein [Aeromonas hydrophila]MBF4798889.1 hypothetical protein [Aeromonas hydrophila]